jgi:NAD(P)-dependent dehydrogenase (short-subunit alcohol dehydrogenase family)
MLFAAEGAKVVITGRDEARGRSVVQEIEAAGGSAVFYPSDVRFAAECRQAVEACLRAYGRLDILFNNAGVLLPNSVPDSSEEEWDLTIDTCLKGTYLMSKFTLPVMMAQEYGVIVNNASGWGLVGGAAAAAYCAAKGGVVLLTKAMAIDHGPQGIRVNCVCPGDVDTPMLPDDARRRGMRWEDYMAAATDRPLGRVGTPEEIAQAVLFLAADDSAFITGAVLAVDGGGTAG